MIILGIETSCDDTSVALLEATPVNLQPPLETGGVAFTIRAEKTASQIDIHKIYGGVVPEVAGREHAEKIIPVIEEVLSHENIKTVKRGNKLVPDVIAVTAGPGLITGLLVGVEAAKTLSYLWDVPVIGINHIEGHIHSVFLGSAQHPSPSPLSKGGQREVCFPALCLIVSGGHTELVLMKDFSEYELVGKTRDDAVGECFDKVAKLLGIDYPGGPKISKQAETGNPQAIAFPRPMLESHSFDFSFSGLKTAALYWLRDNKLAATSWNPIKLASGFFDIRNNEITREDFCASFEQAIVDVLVHKTVHAAQTHNVKTIILAGGVSANKKLRNTLQDAIKESSVSNFLFPDLSYCMDNAAMIAAAAYHRAKKKEFLDWRKLVADPNWKVYEQRHTRHA